MVEFFVDTANVEEIRKAVEWGVVDGVTTNPSLVAKEGRDFKEVITEIASIVSGPLSAEVLSDDAVGMVKEAEEYAAWGKNMAIKIPFTREGIKAVKELSKKGIKTNVTLVFSANQATIAAKAGATYVSVFIGRLDDVGQDGVDVLEECLTALRENELDAKVIAASIRHPRHVKECVALGCDVLTIPFSVLDKMFDHPLTDKGIQRFKDDWAKMK